MNPARAAVALLLFACCAAPLHAAAHPADTVLRNGAVLVFDGIERHQGTESPKFAQAIAIAEGRIVFVGANDAAKDYVGPATRVVDLAGRMVMPGIIDGHFHGSPSTDCDMGYAGGTVAEVLAKLQACLDRPDQAVHKGSNVRLYASQFFGEAITPAGTALTRDDLDRLDTTRPVLVRNADGHKFWMNSKAIGNAGINAQTPTPPDGQIGRDADGRPNGFFADIAAGDWGMKPPVTEDALIEEVRQTIAAANRKGITAVFVPGHGEDEISQWATVQDEGKLTLRVNLGLSASFVHEINDTVALRTRIAALDDAKRQARGLIEVSSVKIFCDGVMEYPAHTAAMLKPYNRNAGTRDAPQWHAGSARGPDPSCSQARQGFVALDKAGWQIHVHGLGDRATRDALDNFQLASEQNGARDLRHTITHLEAIDTADIPRFASLGVIASMSLHWARRDAYTVNGTLGYIDDALYARLFPAGEIWRSGGIVAGGSDYPVDPLLPMVQIETAIDHTGEAIPGVFPGALSPKEAIPDLLAVIRMHTINSAYQLHRERDLGSIEVGKQADLIVLSQNLFEIPTEQISGTRVLMTMLGGKVVYDDAAAGHISDSRSN